LQQSRSFSSKQANKPLPSQDWVDVFPREREGKNYDVNWSLQVDGVAPLSDAFQNARLPVLTTRLPNKVANGKVEVSKPAYTGTYALVEAGDSITHGAFASALKASQEYLSSGVDLFVEDAGLGATAASRVGVRIITDAPAVALIARSLLIPSPPREVNHKARFDGWNFEARWEEPEVKWNGQTFDVSAVPTTPAKGQRPIVAYVGGPGALVAVQFVETNKVIVGANVVVGSEAPIRGLADAIGHAAAVLMNEQQKSSLALSSTSVVRNDKTTVIISADDSVIDEAQAKGIVYGAYANLLSTEGVSALFNGIIGAAAAPSSTHRSTPPAVVSGGKAVLALTPNNLSFAAKHLVFYEKGTKKAPLSEDEAVKRLVELTDDSKTEVAKAIVKGAKIFVAGTSHEALSE